MGRRAATASSMPAGRPTPADWYATLLERFGKEGLEFQGALTLMRLGSLMQKMNINLEAIKGGADTFNNMLWNNQVQSSTNDWTPIYNARNFKTLAEREQETRSRWSPGAQTPSRLAYGEVANRATPGRCSTRCIRPCRRPFSDSSRRSASDMENIRRSRAFRSICSPRPCPGSARSISDTTTTRSVCFRRRRASPCRSMRRRRTDSRNATSS